VQKALEIYNSLAGNISGKAVPKLVIDAPGGGGKVQISPENIIKMNDEEVLLRNREGKLFKYPQVKIREK
jgi:lysine 2,3-aminomutase